MLGTIDLLGSRVKQKNTPSRVSTAGSGSRPRSYKVLGDRLRIVLAAQKMLPAEFARRLGTSPEVVSRYLVGEDLPRQTTFSEILRVLGVTFEELLGIPQADDPEELSRAMVRLRELYKGTQARGDTRDWDILSLLFQVARVVLEREREREREAKVTPDPVSPIALPSLENERHRLTVMMEWLEQRRRKA